MRLRWSAVADPPWLLHGEGMLAWVAGRPERRLGLPPGVTLRPVTDDDRPFPGLAALRDDLREADGLHGESYEDRPLRQQSRRGKPAARPLEAAGC